ncbi:MAG: coproporphyrinogen III oxidase [Bacteroidetes bacterium]|nr:MAG: coproporphyrinogen III oxidase [Bacteroidota bacterium]
MAGIYIHIPFCKQICHYCNFYSLVSVKHRQPFFEALLYEVSLQKNYLQGETIKTIYFGGGTPSLLPAKDLQRIIDSIFEIHPVHPDVEITLEANPDDLDKATISAIQKTSINRLSMGVQSFRDEDLKYLNRVHNASEVISAIKSAQDSGFENMSIDLIFGIPTLSNKNWEENISVFFDLKIPHLSAYALTVEPKTALEVLIRKGKMTPVDEIATVEQFKILMASIKENGFEHYEISNFCEPGLYSRHNRSYWSGEKYLGLGPSSHSFDGNSRQWNISNTGRYIEAITEGKIPYEKEILTIDQQYNEYVLTSLRTIWGTDGNFIKNHFGNKYFNLFTSKCTKFIENGMLIIKGDVIILSEKGKLFADGVSSELFI